jgi:CBS domain-containing protein
LEIMSLDRYCQGRRVVMLDASASAYDAVRALENNHIGSIIVQREGRLVGIVTDRDLARRVIGFDLKARETRLRDVMTPEPATVRVEDTEARRRPGCQPRRSRYEPRRRSGRQEHMAA